MSWAVGDLAVCVDESPDADGLAVPLAEGRTYGVCEVIAMAPGNAKWQTGDGLNLSGIPAEIWGYAAERFRKVVQDKHEACETEFVTLLKRSKQTVTTPVSQLIDKMIEDQEQRYAWLLRAGPIAARMNKQSERDGA